ncbi:E-selectin-like [Branchiostoma floridae x Branchiostoma japonicum]
MKVIIGLLLCFTLVLYVAPVGGRKVTKKCKPLAFTNTTRECDQTPNAEGRYPKGTVCTFDCVEGCVKDKGSRRRECKVKGRTKWWIGGQGLKCLCNPCDSARSHPEGSTSDCGPDQAPYPAGRVCNITCPVGTSGDARKVCTNGHWTGEDLVCEENPCDSPPSHPEGATIACGPDQATYPAGHVCNLTCPVGSSGDTRKVCERGQWSGEDLVCEDNPCDSPPSHPEGSTSDCGLDQPPYPAGHVCNITCPVGSSGDNRKVCEKGQWSGEDLVCEENPCDSPPSHPEGSTSDCGPDEPPYPAGHVCNITCPVGSSGDARKVCEKGQWSGEDLECEGTSLNVCFITYVLIMSYSNESGRGHVWYCVLAAKAPPKLATYSGEKQNSTLPAADEYDDPPAPAGDASSEHGEVCEDQCEDGSTEDGGDDMLQCNDGAWDGCDLICTTKDSNDPPNMDCAVLDGCDAPIEHVEVCNYQCEEGSTENGGDDMQNCNDGAWDGGDWKIVVARFGGSWDAAKKKMLDEFRAARRTFANPAADKKIGVAYVRPSPLP